MANDLVERLEHFGRDFRNTVMNQTCREAAARIEELEKALEPFANAYVNRDKWAEDMYVGGSALRNSDLRAASRAYKGE